MDEKLNPNIPCEQFRIKLNELNMEKGLQDYLVTLFKNVEQQVDTLASFVPFHVELNVY